MRAGCLFAQQLFPARFLRSDAMAHCLVTPERIRPGPEPVEHDVASRTVHRQIGLLGQVANRGFPSSRDASLIGGLDTEKNTGEGGLASAVRSDQPDTLALVNRQVDSVEKGHLPV